MPESQTAVKLHSHLTREVSYPTLMCATSTNTAGACGWLGDPVVELRFCNESGIEGDPRPRRRWVTKGGHEAGGALRQKSPAALAS